MRFSGFSELLRHYAARTPQAPALKIEANGAIKAVGYADLCDAIDARAAALAQTGKTCLGVLCDGSFACVVEIFAAVQAGLQVVLLNENADPDLVAAADIDLLWGDPDLTQELSPALTRGVSDGKGKLLFFTSGTTARRKAVVLTEQSLCASAYNGGALLPLDPADTLLCMLPLDHVFGFVCGLLWALSCGASVALGRGPRHYFDDCAFFRPTALSAVPLLLGFLLQKQLLGDTLRLVLIGAGDCPPQIPAALKAMGMRVSFGYGLTETSSGVALSLGDDPYAMAVCPDDRITLAADGEILIEAPTCVMQGYYKDAEATAAVLRDGVLATGDLGRFDADGLLHIIGRKKEILVLRDGTKIYLPEYEQQLAGALAGMEFATIAIDGAPALVVRGEESQRASVNAALAPLMRTLPLGQRLKNLYFISDPLPRTATGKIKRWELQQKAVSQ
ncbi:MAG: AMP-binding protein [Clostridia bacterium]|nr:AMP-binding protein [Clostridia bacterium]